MIRLDDAERARAALRGAGDSPERIRKAAADFEAVFLAQLFRAMRRTVPEAALIGGGFGERVYREMLDAHFAQTFARSGGTGLGEMIAAELGGEAAARVRLGPEATPAAGIVWPVDGRVTSGFGERSDPIDGVRSFHSGIDVAAPEGTPVHAALDGRVVESGRRGGYGNVVVLDHGGGYTTLYAHNSELLVERGASVRAGDPIARAGSTGRSTGPHLHFEVRRSGVPIDPRLLYGGR